MGARGGQDRGPAGSAEPCLAAPLQDDCARCEHRARVVDAIQGTRTGGHRRTIERPPSRHCGARSRSCRTAIARSRRRVSLRSAEYFNTKLKNLRFGKLDQLLVKCKRAGTEHRCRGILLRGNIKENSVSIFRVNFTCRLRNCRIPAGRGCRAKFMAQIPARYEQEFYNKSQSRQVPTGQTTCTGYGNVVNCQQVMRTEYYTVPAVRTVDRNASMRDALIKRCAETTCHQQYGNLECKAKA